MTTGSRDTISIHALLAESDHDTYVIMEATKVISIHALLAESDGGPGGQNAVILHFYPRSPCGERPSPKSVIYLLDISIHALLAESDQYWATRARAAQLFLSTLSLRRATYSRRACAIL